MSKLPLTFNFVVFYELVSGFVGMVIGIGLAIFGEEIQDIYLSFRDAGVLDHPHNAMIGIVQKYAPFLIGHYLFVGIYLVLVGVFKLTGGVGLMYRKKWADNMLVGLLLLFLPLDIWSLFHHPSITRVLFIFTNIVIIVYLTRKQIVKYF